MFYGLFTYLNKSTNLNTFKNELAHRCSDNQGPTVLMDLQDDQLSFIYSVGCDF